MGKTGLNPDLDLEVTDDLGTNSERDSRAVSIRQSTFRTCFDRHLGTMAKGSMRGSIFALCSGDIGTGVLSLPYVLKINGWVVGTIMIFLGALGKENNWITIY